MYTFSACRSEVTVTSTSPPPFVWLRGIHVDIYVTESLPPERNVVSMTDIMTLMIKGTGFGDIEEDLPRTVG